MASSKVKTKSGEIVGKGELVLRVLATDPNLKTQEVIARVKREQGVSISSFCVSQNRKKVKPVSHPSVLPQEPVAETLNGAHLNGMVRNVVKAHVQSTAVGVEHLQKAVKILGAKGVCAILDMVK